MGVFHLFSVIGMEVEVLRLFERYGGGCAQFVWCDKYGDGGSPFVWCYMCGGDPFVWCDKYVGGGASFV